jgi:heme oxygenase
LAHDVKNSRVKSLSGGCTEEFKITSLLHHITESKIVRISERLKAFTAASHQRIEKSIVGLIQDLETPEDYIHLLGLFYSYFGGLEQLVDEQHLRGNLPDIGERRKALCLSEDINTLRGRVPEIAQNEYLPVIDNCFQAFGALYVIEGSTLGGVHIVKMIRRKIKSEENVFRFFSGYGEQTFCMWDKFKHVLDGLSQHEDDIAQILTGAEDTFQKFGKWINSNSYGKAGFKQL